MVNIAFLYDYIMICNQVYTKFQSKISMAKKIKLRKSFFSETRHLGLHAIRSATIDPGLIYPQAQRSVEDFTDWPKCQHIGHACGFKKLQERFKTQLRGNQYRTNHRISCISLSLINLGWSQWRPFRLNQNHRCGYTRPWNNLETAGVESQKRSLNGINTPVFFY